MRKLNIVVTLLLLIFVIAGCQSNDVPSVTKGDFTMELPEGYTITDVTDTQCSIEKDGEAIGGIILTQLTEKNMDEKFPIHLDSVTGTDVINEFFSWEAKAEDGSPMQLVTHNMTDPATDEKKEFYRILFVKDGGVYDMWFDMEQIEIEEIEENFYPLF